MYSVQGDSNVLTSARSVSSDRWVSGPCGRNVRFSREIIGIVFLGMSKGGVGVEMNIEEIFENMKTRKRSFSSLHLISIVQLS